MDNKTEIFKSYDAFYHRADKDANGVSPEFAADNPNYADDNLTNRACWNCKSCDGCDGCAESADCRDCTLCQYCTNCKGCDCCDDCNNREGAKNDSRSLR